MRGSVGQKAYGKIFCKDRDGRTGSAEQCNLPWNIELLEHILDRNSHGYAGDCDQIVAACVSDSRQGIHFRVHADSAATRAMRERREPGCLQEVVFLDLKSMLLHEGGQRIMSIAAKIIMRLDLDMDSSVSTTHRSSKRSSGRPIIVCRCMPHG